MVDYKVSVYNAARDNNLVALKVSQICYETLSLVIKKTVNSSNDSYCEALADPHYIKLHCNVVKSITILLYFICAVLCCLKDSLVIITKQLITVTMQYIYTQNSIQSQRIHICLSLWVDLVAMALRCRDVELFWWMNKGKHCCSLLWLRASWIKWSRETSMH